MCLKIFEVIKEKEIDTRLIFPIFFKNENILHIKEGVTLSIPLLNDVECQELQKKPIEIIEDKLIHYTNEDIYYQLEVDEDSKTFEYNVFEGDIENEQYFDYELIAVSKDSKKILLSDEGLYVADIETGKLKCVNSSYMSRYTIFDTYVTDDRKYMFVISNINEPYSQTYGEVMLFNNETFEYICEVDIGGGNSVESVTQSGSTIVITTEGLKNRVFFFDLNNPKKKCVEKHNSDKKILYSYLLEYILIILTDDSCYRFYKI